MNNIDLDAIKKQGLISIEKYKKYTIQVEIEIDWLDDFLY